MHIRLACREDLPWLTEQDHHVSPAVLQGLVDQAQVFVALEDETPVGWLRWNLFWDNTPFMNLLYLLKPWRGRGFGRAMAAHWERWMREQGYCRVLTSTQSDEGAQHFYRKLGYRECGALVMPGDPLEIFFIKELNERDAVPGR